MQLRFSARPAEFLLKAVAVGATWYDKTQDDIVAQLQPTPRLSRGQSVRGTLYRAATGPRRFKYVACKAVVDNSVLVNVPTLYCDSTLCCHSLLIAANAFAPQLHQKLRLRSSPIWGQTLWILRPEASSKARTEVGPFLQKREWHRKDCHDHMMFVYACVMIT